MRTRFFRFIVLAAVVASCGSSEERAAVKDDPVYVVGSIPLPAVVAADIVVAGTAVLVGQGPFGARLQSIVRRDADGSTTTIVSGLSSIGGLAYDSDGDRLLFTDNAGELGGATHGDTVYALPSPLTVASPVAASTFTRETFSGVSKSRSGCPSSARFMNAVQIGVAARPPV